MPLTNSGPSAEARVFLVEPNKKPFDVAAALVSLGFAQAVSLPKEINLLQDKKIQKYVKQLTSAELKAKSQRRGQWHSLPKPWLAYKIRKQWDHVIYALTPSKRRLPELVR